LRINRDEILHALIKGMRNLSFKAHTNWNESRKPQVLSNKGIFYLNSLEKPLRDVESFLEKPISLFD